MRVRRVISLLLLAVYLTAVGGASFASLTCRCVMCHHASCPYRTRAAVCPAPQDNSLWSAPCCSDRHSTEIDLYTAGSQDDNVRYLRSLVIDLPADLAAECPCPAHCPALRHAPDLRPTPLRPNPVPACRGLRAPPVLA